MKKYRISGINKNSGKRYVLGSVLAKTQISAKHKLNHRTKKLYKKIKVKSY